ncbi:MAG: winged helix-turn-helix domain-containing protein, partial [Nitrospirae bacterium]|nr:winged helix-turn-helix domain-containing protein [Nitrospirota bacterium]
VTSSCMDAEGAKRAKQRVDQLTEEVKVGKIYEGRVSSVKDFGAFVEILPGKDGLVHISELSEEYVQSVADICQVGDKMPVKVIAIDDQERVYVVDREAHRVWLGSVEIEPPLSPPQFRLLSLMYENPDRVVTREQIVESVWPDVAGEGVSEQAIDALVRRLRERLSEVDSEHPYVTTVRGHGFRLNNPR